MVTTHSGPVTRGVPHVSRANTIFGQPDRIDAGIAQLENSDHAAVEAIRGNRGLTTMVDRQAGVTVALSYWDELAHSSEVVLTQAREGAVAVAVGGLVAESYEVAVDERISVSGTDAVVRMVRMVRMVRTD